MTIRLIHVHQLETLYLCYGVKGQPGVIRGHRGQKVIFTKNAFSTDYMAWLCNSLNKYISLRPSIPFMGSRSTWGHFRQQISCALTRKGHVFRACLVLYLKIEDVVEEVLKCHNTTFEI